jgi:hypothetical protein
VANHNVTVFTVLVAGHNRQVRISVYRFVPHRKKKWPASINKTFGLVFRHLFCAKIKITGALLCATLASAQ